MRALLSILFGSFLMWFGFTVFLGWKRQEIPWIFGLGIFVIGIIVAVAGGFYPARSWARGLVSLGSSALLAAIPMELVSPRMVNNGSGQDVVDLVASISGIVVGGAGILALLAASLTIFFARKSS